MDPCPQVTMTIDGPVVSVLEFFDFTQTPVDVVPADLDWFSERVAELLAAG